MTATEIETNFPAVDSARRARQFSDVLVGLGVAVWFMTAAVLTFRVSESDRYWGMVGGVLVGAFAFLQLYLVALVLRLLADITDGVNSPSNGEVESAA